MTNRTIIDAGETPHFHVEYSYGDHEYVITPLSADAARALADTTRSHGVAAFRPTTADPGGEAGESHGEYVLHAADGYRLGRLVDDASAAAESRSAHAAAPAPPPEPDEAEDRPNVPDTLTVVLADTQGTYTAVVHENEHRPYRRRTVQVTLTDDQRRALEPRCTGITDGAQTHEEHLSSWLEPASTPLTRTPRS